MPRGGVLRSSSTNSKTSTSRSPASDRWNTVTKEEIAQRLADLKDSLSKTRDRISIDSLNSEIEDAEAAMKAAKKGETVWFAEDEDGGYYAVGSKDEVSA